MISIPEFTRSGNRRPPPIEITPAILSALDVQLASAGLTSATVARRLGLPINPVVRPDLTERAHGPAR